MDPNGRLDAEFADGSGYTDSHKAKYMNLIYGTSKDDYINIWYNISQSVDGNCCANLMLTQLNYHSMAAHVDVKSTFVVSFPKTLTNVDTPNSMYVA